MIRKIVTAVSAAFCLTVAITATAESKVLSQSKAKVTQLKIVHSETQEARVDYSATGSATQPDAWGVYSNYIGPGDINRLGEVVIYLDLYNNISAVKITRESYNGDTVTSIFTQVKEFSIQTLKPGTKRPYKETTITIKTADSITFP